MSLSRFEWEPILRFWLGPDPADPAAVKLKEPLWFAADDATDAEIRRRFGEVWAAAARGEIEVLDGEPRRTLAVVLLLDQFTRNLERGKAAAFAHDATALAIASTLIDAGADRGLHPPERSFLVLPFEHAEDPVAQRRAVELATALVADTGPDWTWLTDSTLHWAKLHAEIIERFGRFPHRNRVLGRPSTPAEERYLAEGGLHFGQ